MSLKNQQPQYNSDDYSSRLTDDYQTIIGKLFLPLFRELFSGREFIESVEDDCQQANINKPVDLFLSQLMGYGIISGLFLTAIPVGIYLFFIAPDAIVASSQNVTYALKGLVITVGGLVGATVIGATAFISGVYYPVIKKRRRERHINLVLPDTLSFMYSLSVGGTNQIEIIRAVARADDTYHEVSSEFRRIAYQMEYFNIDYQTAVEHVAETTPSDDLEEILTDMLSVINSGGDITTFLDTKQDQLRERTKNRQEAMLDTIEVFGHMYMTLNILPLGLLIVLVVISLMGSPAIGFMATVVYGVIPGLNIMFGLLIATVKQDELGNGELEPTGEGLGLTEDETTLLDMRIINKYRRSKYNSFFNGVRKNELKYRIVKILKAPWAFFRIRPSYTLAVTVPLSILLLGIMGSLGMLSISPDTIIKNTYTQTVLWLYVPTLIIIVPLAFFYEWNRRTEGEILDTLTQDIRKLANANETGQPILEALRISAEGTDSRLTTEFQSVYKKTQFGVDLSAALIQLNNKYTRPRLARIIKLIDKAQEASSNITQVLRTAAKTSRYQDELVESRIRRTRMQVAIISISFLVFLGIFVLLEVFFLEQMVEGMEARAEADASAPGGGTQIDPNVISMFFFHAVTLQALCAGVVSGYMQTAKIQSSFKYVIAYMLLAAITWGAFVV